MPRRRLPPTLATECLRVICNSIDWFVSHQCQFDCLTGDLISQIYSQLKSRPGTRRQHFELILTEQITKIDLSSPFEQHDGGDMYVDATMDILYARMPNLTKINLANVLHIPQIFWTGILPSLSNLQVLSLRSSNCGDHELHIIANHCHRLKELDLSLCARVTNWSVATLSSGPCGRHLQHLDLMQTQVNEHGVQCVLMRCPSLLSLKWRNTINVLSQIYRDRSGSSNRLVDDTMPTSLPLQQLISDASYRLYSLQGATQMCRQAVQVTIDGPSQLLAEELQALEALDCLRELHVVLDRCSSTGVLLDFREGFDSILLKHGSSLQSLTLGRIANVDINRIVRFCRQLTSLSLERNYSYCSETVPGGPVRLLAKFHVAIRDWQATDDEVDCSSFDVPPSCLALLLGSPSLRHIKLTACQTVDDQILSSCLASTSSIECLELESCASISMNSIWTLVHQSKYLSTLKIYRCSLITDDNVTELCRMANEQQWDLELDYYRDDES